MKELDEYKRRLKTREDFSKHEELMDLILLKAAEQIFSLPLLEQDAFSRVGRNMERLRKLLPNVLGSGSGEAKRTLKGKTKISRTTDEKAYNKAIEAAWKAWEKAETIQFEGEMKHQAQRNYELKKPTRREKPKDLSAEYKPKRKKKSSAVRKAQVKTKGQKNREPVSEPKKEAPDQNNPVTVAEIMAEFLGNAEEMIAYLRENGKKTKAKKAETLAGKIAELRKAKA